MDDFKENLPWLAGRKQLIDARVYLHSPGVAELERQLAEAQRSMERLSGENERLMEISSELRAQRHKADRAAALAGELITFE